MLLCMHNVSGDFGVIGNTYETGLPECVGPQLEMSKKSVEIPKQPYKSLGSSDDCLCRELSAGSFSFIMGFSPCLWKKIIVLIVVMLPSSLRPLSKKNEDQKHQKCSGKCLKVDQVGWLDQVKA